MDSLCRHRPDRLENRMGNELIKVLYIASNGRSGSTLLELLLSAHSHLWTTGELYVLPFEVETPRKPCGCGSAFADCAFWGPIIAAHRPALQSGSINRFRDHYLGGRLIQPRELPYLYSRNGGVP